MFSWSRTRGTDEYSSQCVALLPPPCRVLDHISRCEGKKKTQGDELWRKGSDERDLILLHLVAEMDFVVVGFLCCIWAGHFWQINWLVAVTLISYIYICKRPIIIMAFRVYGDRAEAQVLILGSLMISLEQDRSVLT